MTLSQELREIYASGKNDVVLHTLELNHPSFGGPLYIVRDYVNLVANLENSGPEVTFVTTAFSITPPQIDESGIKSLGISIDNVGREVIEKLELALDGGHNPITVTYRIYIASDTTGPQNDPPLKLLLTNISVDNFTASGTAATAGMINRRFPNKDYGNVFKSLFYNID